MWGAGGICEFGVLHPSLCEVSVTPAQRSISIGPRATTPGRLSGEGVCVCVCLWGGGGGSSLKSIWLHLSP